MKPGASVQVRQVWAYAWPEPLRDWFDGYRLESLGPDFALVSHTRGTFAGCVVRFRTSDVRPAHA